jgi:hypothetical protein
VGLRRFPIAVVALAVFTACGVKGPEQWRKSDCEKAGEEACLEYSGDELNRCVALYVYDCGQGGEP